MMNCLKYKAVKGMVKGYMRPLLGNVSELLLALRQIKCLAHGQKRPLLKVHKIENFFDSDFGICVISLLVMSKY